MCIINADFPGPVDSYALFLERSKRILGSLRFTTAESIFYFTLLLRNLGFVLLYLLSNKLKVQLCARAVGLI